MPAVALPLPTLPDRLPLPVPPSLDPVLDATVECIARHGLSRTSMSDIARELGVAPSTVYRKVGSVDGAVLLVVAREAERFLARVPDVMASASGPRAITAVVAACVRTAAEHPMTAKILRDDSDWLGRVVSRRLDAFLAQGAEVARPMLEAAMDARVVRRQDATLLAHWLLRVALAALVSPPPGDLDDALDALLLPMLTPAARR